MKIENNGTKISINKYGETMVISDNEFYSKMMKCFFDEAGIPVKLKAEYTCIESLWKETGKIIGKFLLDNINLSEITGTGDSITAFEDTLLMSAINFCGTKLNIKNLFTDDTKESRYICDFLNELYLSMEITLHIKKIEGIQNFQLFECIFRTLGSSINKAVSLKKAYLYVYGNYATEKICYH